MKNHKFQRINEARHYAKRIRAKYGQSAEILDHGNGWSIYLPVRVSAGMFGIQDRTLWHGKSLRESL